MKKIRAKAEEKECWGGGYKFKCGINDTVTQRPGRSETINVSVIWRGKCSRQMEEKMLKA